MIKALIWKKKQKQTRSFHHPFFLFHSPASLQDLSLPLFILALIKFAKSPDIITKWSFWAVTNVQSGNEMQLTKPTAHKF